MLAVLALAVVAAATQPSGGPRTLRAQIVQLGSDGGSWSEPAFASSIEVYGVQRDFAAASRRLMREVRPEGPPLLVGPRYGRPATVPVVDILPLVRWADARLARR